MSFISEILHELGFGSTKNYKEKKLTECLKKHGIEHIDATNMARNIHETMETFKRRKEFSTGLVPLREQENEERLIDDMFSILEKNETFASFNKEKKEKIFDEICGSL